MTLITTLRLKCSSCGSRKWRGFLFFRPQQAEAFELGASHADMTFGMRASIQTRQRSTTDGTTRTLIGPKETEMCGRFAQKLPSHRLLNLYETKQFTANVPPNFNVAPTQTAMVIRGATEDSDREIALYKWGLIPRFSKTGKMDRATFNARSETVATSPVFRDSYQSRRCIVPADAFYEWKKLGEGPKPPKQPYAIARADGEPLAFAGLWARWKPKEGGEPVQSFTILTTEPNELMSEIHNRMPVILGADDVPVWLGEERGDFGALMRPCPADWLKAWTVSARVGNVQNNDPSLMEPVSPVASETK